MGSTCVTAAEFGGASFATCSRRTSALSTISGMREPRPLEKNIYIFHHEVMGGVIMMNMQ